MNNQYVRCFTWNKAYELGELSLLYVRTPSFTIKHSNTSTNNPLREAKTYSDDFLWRLQPNKLNNQDIITQPAPQTTKTTWCPSS